MINNKKIYALVIEARDAIFLSAQYSTSLEQALAQAKEEYKRINKITDDSGLNGAKISLFTMKTVDQLINENKSFKEDPNNREGMLLTPLEPIPVLTPPAFMDNINKTKIEINPEIDKLMEIAKRDSPENKNKLMKKIITNKDPKMFEENKELFSKNEIKYIEEHLRG